MVLMPSFAEDLSHTKHPPGRSQSHKVPFTRLAAKVIALKMSTDLQFRAHGVWSYPMLPCTVSILAGCRTCTSRPDEAAVVLQGIYSDAP